MVSYVQSMAVSELTQKGFRSLPRQKDDGIGGPTPMESPEGVKVEVVADGQVYLLGTKIPFVLE